MDKHTCPLCGCAGQGSPISANSIAYRFWSKVKVGRPDTCWEWQGSRTSFGHGRFRMDGKARTAHRVAYWLHHGTWPPEGQVVRHSCDNPPCVNPAHLLLGTHADNTRDKIERGRQAPNANSLKTHCKRGHEFTPENTGLNKPIGTRYCKKCKALWNREWQRQRRKTTDHLHGGD